MNNDNNEPRKRFLNDNPMDGMNLVDTSEIQGPPDWALEELKVANNMNAAKKGFSEWQVDNLRRGIREKHPDYNPRQVEVLTSKLLRKVEYGQ